MSIGVCKCSLSFLFSSPLSLSSSSSPCSQFSLSSLLHVPNPFRKCNDPCKNLFYVKVSYAGYNTNTDPEESNIWPCEYQCNKHFFCTGSGIPWIMQRNLNVKYTHMHKSTARLLRLPPSAIFLEGFTRSMNPQTNP